MRKPNTWLVMLVTSVLCAVSIAADNVRLQIDLEQALIRTMETNPELVAQGYELQVGEGLLQQAGLASNPTLQVELEDVLGTGDFNTFGGAQTTISIGWLLEQRRIQRRKDVAQANLALLENEQEIARVDKAAETARRYLVCLLQQARQANLSQSVHLAKDTVNAVQKRVSASKAPAAELARAQADLARKQLLLEDAEHELQTAYRYLAAQWGETEPQFTQVSGDLHSLPVVESYQSLIDRLDNNPEYARLASQQGLSESELALAKELGKPQWEMSAGIRRFEADDDQAFVFGISVPLTFKNRNQGQIAATHAKLMQIEAHRKVLDTQLKTRLFALYQELQHSHHRASALRDVIIPSYQRALDDTRQAYQRGRYSYLEWQGVQADLIQANQDLVETIGNAHRYVIEIERLTGEQIVQVAEQFRERS